MAVVASNWNYAKEYILSNENGVIFEYQNYEDMYKKVTEMISSRKIEKFKIKSRELSKKYMLTELLRDFKKEIER